MPPKKIQRPSFISVPQDIAVVPTNKKAKILKECHLLVFSTKNPKPIDLAEIMYRFFIITEPTYVIDSEGSEQCTRGRARSIEDLYMLCRSYLPKISYIKLEDRVKSLYNKYINHDFCNTVKREVHRPLTLSTTVEAIRKHLEEGGNNLVVKEK